MESGGLNRQQRFFKRMFDVFFSFIGLLILIVPITILILFASFSTGSFGLFTQKRIGLKGNLFTIYKIRTMKGKEEETSISALNKNRITSFGIFLRSTKLDELPQLFNVLIGTMSIVGPRPDVIGYADQLHGDDSIILSVKPGITGPASLKFKNEEKILDLQRNPKEYNDKIIWKEKVKINKQYIENWTLLYDIRYILKTIFHLIN